ncbi:MAG TPA: helix-turn-helix domain-containing protein [candidate division Zixibacteria bacterium]|nr:helix-turn-helix domain-containing protein [candidate division Zixibacteria bacterium]
MLTTRQAAAILNVSEQTLKKWRQRNMEPEFIRYHGEAVRYRLTTILKFLVASTVKL